MEDKNPGTVEGFTPLHYAALNGHLEVCQFILSRVEDKNPSDNDDRTPLHCAIIWERENAFNLLISLGADVNAQNESRFTSLMFAISWTNDPVRTSFVRSLLKANADVNVKDINVKNGFGKNAFDWANHCGWRKEFNRLIAESLSS